MCRGECAQEIDGEECRYHRGERRHCGRRGLRRRHECGHTVFARWARRCVAAHEQNGSCAAHSRRSGSSSLRATLARAHRALTMADRISGNLQDKISARLRFYQDIGIDLFYRDRAASASSSRAGLPASESKTTISSSVSVVEEYSETIETVVVAESPVEESSAFEDTLP